MRRAHNTLLRALRPKLNPGSQYLRSQLPTRNLSQQSLSRPRPTFAATRSRYLAFPQARRCESNLATTGDQAAPPEDTPPAYQLTFTCKPCSTRSTHRVTKQGYHHGTTLITCPNCKSRHLISDHLKIFSDEGITLEDILSKTLPDGKPLTDLLKKGKLGMRQGAMIANEGDEDIEFWEDGTETTHQKAP